MSSLFNKEQEKEIVRRYCDDGNTLTKIAKDFGCYIQPVERVLIKNNVNIKKGRRKSDPVKTRKCNVCKKMKPIDDFVFFM
jgi:DNA invertase Pin-like site-specific DNA recombinase